MLTICKNQEECFFGNHPTLRELDQVCEGSGLAVIGKSLELVNIVTNYKIKLNDIQIVMLSGLIFQKFSYLKETELTLFFYDIFGKFSEDKFFGSIEIQTIINLLTDWVKNKRANAIYEHDKQIKRREIEEYKHLLMNWKEYRERHGLDLSESPVRNILSSFGNPKVPKDTKESTSDFAKVLIENKFGFDDAATLKARRAFVLRYGYTPEDFLRKEGIYD